MEKKTIGKFISALRKANGMTQKELGEKLFVSDKTVSRWERDECTPELSLIPVIAEIFGITTDELLRGERSNPEREDVTPSLSAEKQRAKSDKQFRVMLHNRLKKYKNLTLISVGISILGLIAAMIANLGFQRALIAFCLATAFIVASEICQICFTINARLLIDEDDDTYTEKIRAANTKITETAIIFTVFNVALFAFCLPMVLLGFDPAYFGLSFNSWMLYGILLALISLFVCRLIYSLFIQRLLIDKGILTYDETRECLIKKSALLLRRITAVAASIALVLGIGLVVLNEIGVYGFADKLVFEDPYEFKEFVENEYDKFIKEESDRIPDTVYYPKSYGQIKDDNGNVICEYYYAEHLYEHISFRSLDRMPVTVITNQAYYDAYGLFNFLQGLLLFLIVVDLLVCACVYGVKRYKICKI